MRLEDISVKTKSKNGKGLRFHTKEEGQYFVYRLNNINKYNVNLRCKHSRRGCKGSGSLKLGSISVIPKNPNADRIR